MLGDRAQRGQVVFAQGCAAQKQSAFFALLQGAGDALDALYGHPRGRRGGQRRRRARRFAPGAVGRRYQGGDLPVAAPRGLHRAGAGRREILG